MNDAPVPDLRDLAQSYTEALHHYFGPRLVSVVLYGSVARGENTSTSDVDLIVVAESLPGNRKERNALLETIERPFLPILEEWRRQKQFVDFSILLYTPTEAKRTRPLYLDLVKDAIVLYDRNHFFATILQHLRSRLERLGARRRRWGRFRYWDLKPDYRWGEQIEL